MTTTQASLDRVREIIDCYVEHDLQDIFLRPLSPYGFAIKTKSYAAYDVDGRAVIVATHAHPELNELAIAQIAIDEGTAVAA